MNPNGKEAMHYRVAERGKLHSLDGNYAEALRYYREAIHMTVRSQSPDVFFQHYAQCVMEALELSGAYDEVIAYCEKVGPHLAEKAGTSDVARKTLAWMLERQAIQYFLKSDPGPAADLLQQAETHAGKGKQPIASQLLAWAQRGYRISATQIRDLQRKYGYFIVRRETVNPAIAIDLPNTPQPTL